MSENHALSPEVFQPAKRSLLPNPRNAISHAAA